MRLAILVAACVVSCAPGPALAEIKSLPKDARFCRSWAEAHERTLASLNNGRAPYPVKWKGRVWLKRNAQADVVASDENATEVVVKGVRLFTDERLF